MHWLTRFHVLVIGLAFVTLSHLWADEEPIRKELTAKGARFDLWGVNIYNANQWTEADFQKLAQLRSLTSLWIQDGPSDGQLKMLEDMPDIRHFTCNKGKFSDEGLKSLATFKKLESIELWTPGITLRGSGFAELAALPLLQRLSINGNNSLGNEGWADISKLPHITTLEIEQLDPKLQAWAALGRMSSLQTLVLGSSYYSGTLPPYLPDGTLQGILQLSQLQQFGLKGVAMHLQDFEKLKQLPHLQVISLEDARLSKDHVKQLRSDLAPIRVEYTSNGRFPYYILW